MTPSVSAVVVTHRSASEAAACVGSLRAAFEAEGIAGETVVVDCGSGEEEANLLRGIPSDELVLLPDNRGYSGGVNAGLERARGATVLVCNADVAFLPGAVRELAAAVVERRVGAAAPLCLWDSAGLLRLPADPPSGSRPPSSASCASRRFARRTLSLWQRGGEAKRLVGAVLAARREVFDRVGGFDESFPFEYEETDWEIRVRRAGFALRFHPAARVRHLYARSAARNPDTEARRAASRRLFRSRYYGAFGRAVIESAERRTISPRAERVAEPVVRARRGAWVAVSTNPTLVPFAGAPLDSDFRLPDEVLASLRAGPVYLRAFRASDGAALETVVWEKP